MTKDGAALAVDTAQLIASLFALIPVPVAVADDRGAVVLANSCFSDTFPRITNISTLPQHGIEAFGGGTFELHTLPLNELGFKIVFATDVTDEAQLRQQVTRLEKMAALGRVVTGVAQELKKPLREIAEYRQGAEQCELSGEARGVMDATFARAERAEHLVQTLLVLAGVSTPRHVQFDLNAIVKNVTEQSARRKDARNFDIVLNLEPDLPNAIGDPSQIEQVVLTLLLSAQDAIGDMRHRPGSIQFRTAARAGRIQLHVVDNGAVRDVAQLFEPHEGGVGLNICSQIVKDHGGELYAWSAYGHGTTLTMELPVYVQDKAGAEDASPSPIRGKSIMIIDDDVHITELLHEVLARRGATVEVSNSGPTAYDQLRCNDYDLILCDQNMPGLNGPTLFRLAEIWNPRIKNKFLFMTGDVVVGSAGPFSSETGVQYLRKPFRMQDLVDTVEAFFNRSLTPNS